MPPSQPGPEARWPGQQEQPSWQGEQVWQVPQYGGQAPPWQSAYGQGDGPLAQARTADAGPRLGARILDWLIVGIPFAALGLGLGYLAEPQVSANGTVQMWDTAMIVLQLAEIVVRLVYQAAFVAFKGATPGKMACGIRVVDESTGQRLSFGRALAREVVLMLSALLCLIGYFSLFFDSLGLKRGWHDKAVKSRVIRA
ncbi:MAG: RDD family protein [Austwickia sp.]|jgi:uncharacterized RDD family membrane protein YckC|nr:MAG: RDD family protein [Austwickia sp.]